jgi:pimeloyl-ACP methyl ester carboxylesterase
MTASASAVGQQIEVNGASLYVTEQGEGDPLVLVHMGLASGSSWDHVVPLLAEQFRVITYDSRGFGRSTNPAGVLSHNQLVDDTAALLDALELERPFVGGWSDGGEVALRFGVRYPGRARALVAGATGLEGSSERVQAKTREFFRIGEDGRVDFEAFAAMMEDRLLPMMRQWHPGGEEQLRAIVQQSAEMYLVGYDRMTREQIERYVGRIAEPTLIVVGDQDEFVLVEEAVELFRWIPNAELAILPGTSHLRPIFDATTFVCAVTDFLRRH